MLTYTIIVNSTVHMFMYSYYLVAIFSKQLPFKLTIVKKFITVFQIVSLFSIIHGINTEITFEIFFSLGSVNEHFGERRICYAQ